MSKAQPRPSKVGNVILSFSLVIGGALWIAVALFFLSDAIDDWREARSPEFSDRPGPTWWEGFQHVGGFGGALIALAPPIILVVCGSCVLGRALRASCKPRIPNPQ